MNLKRMRQAEGSWPICIIQLGLLAKNIEVVSCVKLKLIALQQIIKSIMTSSKYKKIKICHFMITFPSKRLNWWHSLLFKIRLFQHAQITILQDFTYPKYFLRHIKTTFFFYKKSLFVLNTQLQKRYILHLPVILKIEPFSLKEEF